MNVFERPQGTDISDWDRNASSEENTRLKLLCDQYFLRVRDHLLSIEIEGCMSHYSTRAIHALQSDASVYRFADL